MRVLPALFVCLIGTGCGDRPAAVKKPNRPKTAGAKKKLKSLTEQTEDLRRILNANKLDRISEQIVKASLPSLRLKSRQIQEDALQLGQSRIGGRPDLPKSIAWPESKGKPQSFIAQINFADISDADQLAPLPRKGIAYFFYDVAEQPWGFDPKDKGGWHVAYYDGPVDALTRSPFPSEVPNDARFQACSIEFVLTITVPSYDSRALNAIDLTDAEEDIIVEGLYEEDESYESDDHSHQLLGHPRLVQGDMQTDCPLVTAGLYLGDATGYEDPRAEGLMKQADDWTLLLQIDSDEDLGVMWGDSGMIYYWIRTEDLKQARFDRTWLFLQCY